MGDFQFKVVLKNEQITQQHSSTYLIYYFIQLTLLVKRKPDDTIGHLCGDSVAVLVAVERAITDEECNKRLSHDLIVKMASHPSAPKLMFACQPFTNELKYHLNANDQVRFIIHDVCCFFCKNVLCCVVSVYLHTVQNVLEFGSIW